MIEFDGGHKERKYEERVAWLFLAMVALVLGFAIGRAVEKGKSPPDTLGVEAPLEARISALEARAAAEAARRCLAVQTDKLEFTVYQTPNLGIKKVSKP